MGLEQPIVDLRTRFLAAIAEFRILTHIRESFMDNESIIADLNAEQMFQGQDSDGNPISPPYTEVTKIIKRAKGQPTDRVTLRDTGAFQRRIFLRFAREAFDLDSSDPKTEELVFKYGDEIFGLNEETRNKIPELFLIEDLRAAIRRDLNLNGS